MHHAATLPTPQFGPDNMAQLLAQALAEGQIAAAFQPKVALAHGRLVGVEALARWTSPLIGPVPPEIFIPLAEREGLIADLTQTILQDALATCAVLRQHIPGMTMAVNFSPILLDDDDFPAQIDSALLAAGVPASALVAEITESQIIHDSRRAGATLKALRERGITCSIDDFGTGHSSLLSLLRLPFNELKIDRAFVTNCSSDPDARMIVQATLGLAREMRLNVVAEGIETEAPETMLRNLGCTIGQGFRYGRATGIAGILAERPTANLSA